MSPAAQRPPAATTERWPRLAPGIAAGVLALSYVIISPASLDLAAHLFRAQLFGREPFGIWNDYWYAGHHTPGYSLLFPAVAWLLTPQVAGALAAVGTAVCFSFLVRDAFGPRAWVGATWLGVGTAINLYTGRLAFAFGLLPAVAALLALSRGRPRLAALLAALSALLSPVAALFAALSGAAHAGAAYGRAVPSQPAERRRTRTRAALPGAGVVLAALLPVACLTLVFPEGSTEPFTLATLWPALVIATAVALTAPAHAPALRAGAALYALGCLAAYLIPNAAGSNVARLAPLVGGPVAALIWWRRRPLLLALVVPPLFYLQWQAPVRDVRNAGHGPETTAAYYQPLLRFLDRSPGPPFRVEIPFTFFHWEALEVAPRYPLARGWERQLDEKDNQLFYRSPLTAATYRLWLGSLAVRYVALPDSRLDFAGLAEGRLVRGGLPYLRPVFSSRHWTVYQVQNPSPLVTGSASATQLGPDSVSLRVLRPGSALVRVRFTPYWRLSAGAGCVFPAGDFTALKLRRPGPATLSIDFALSRIGSRAPRCR